MRYGDFELIQGIGPLDDPEEWVSGVWVVQHALHGVLGSVRSFSIGLRQIRAAQRREAREGLTGPVQRENVGGSAERFT